MIEKLLLHFAHFTAWFRSGNWISLDCSILNYLYLLTNLQVQDGVLGPEVIRPIVLTAPRVSPLMGSWGSSEWLIRTCRPKNKKEWLQIMWPLAFSNKTTLLYCCCCCWFAGFGFNGLWRFAGPFSKVSDVGFFQTECHMVVLVKSRVDRKMWVTMEG